MGNINDIQENNFTDNEKKTEEDFIDNEDAMKILGITEEDLKEDLVEDKRIIIPRDAVDEFKYLSNNQPARMICIGHMIDEGFVIDEMHYKL